VKKYETGLNVHGYGDLTEIEGDIPKLVLPSKAANHFKLVINKDEKDVKVGKQGIGFIKLNAQGHILALASADGVYLDFYRVENFESTQKVGETLYRGRHACKITNM